MADNIDITASMGERTLKLKELDQMLANASEVLKQLTQYYSGSSSFLAEESILYTERTKTLQKELAMLQEYGRSTYLKEIEIKEKDIAKKAADALNAKLLQNMDAIKVLNSVSGPLSLEGKNYVEAYDEILKDSGQTVEDMITKIKDAGLDAGEARKLLEKNSKEATAKFGVLFVAALKKEAQAEGAGQDLETFAKSKKYLEDTVSLSKQLATNMLGVADYSNSLAMNLLKVPNAVGAMVKGFKEMLNPLNLGLNLVMKIASVTKDMIFSFDKMFAMYSKDGGLIEMDRDMLMTAGMALQKEGISEEVAGRVGASLHSMFADFSMLNESARLELTKTGARLETVGLSASVYAGMLNKLTNTLGKSAMESNAIILDLEQSSRELGISAKQMGEQFNTAFDKLSMYGLKGINVLKGLQREAKKTGIEMSTLIALEEKFTTFDNTAEFAGKMAAIAGKTVIDPVKLMMATGDEKIAMVRQALQAANIKDPRGIMFMAKGLGLSNSEVQALADQTNDKQDPKKSATSFQNVVQMSITLAEKFKNALKSLAVAVGPLLTVLGWLVSVVQAILGVWDGWLVKGPLIVGIIIMLARNFILLGKSILFAIGNLFFSGIGNAIKGLVRYAFGMKTLAAASATAVAPVAAVNTEMTATGPALASAGTGLATFSSIMTSLSAGAAGMLAFGAMLLLIAAGIWVLAQAMKGFAQAAGMATIEMWLTLAAGIALLSVAFFVFITVMSSALPLVGLAIPAFIMLTILLVMLAATLPGVAEKITPFAAGLIELGDAFVSFASSMISAGGSILWSPFRFVAGLTAFQSAIRGLSSAFSEANLDTMNAFNSVISSLMRLSQRASAFTVVANGIRQISSALSELNSLEALGLTAKLYALQQFSMQTGQGITQTVNAVAGLDDTKLANFEKLVTVSEKLVNVTKDSEVDKLASLINNTKEVINNNVKSGGGVGGEMTVKVMIDEREIGRVAVKYAREELLGGSLMK